MFKINCLFNSSIFLSLHYILDVNINNNPKLMNVVIIFK